MEWEYSGWAFCEGKHTYISLAVSIYETNYSLLFSFLGMKFVARFKGVRFYRRMSIC